MKSDPNKKKILPDKEEYDLLTQNVTWSQESYKQKIQISKNVSADILQLAKKLIAIPSTKDNPQGLKEVLEIAKGELQGYYPIEEFESGGIHSLLIHNTSERTKHFRIILNAHVDVVPAAKEQFQPYEKNGRLYGRGAYDMKAAAAVMILLFRQLAKNLAYPIGLQISTDEENKGIHSTKYQIEKGVRAEFVIAGEDTDLDIKIMAKGVLWVILRAKGKAAHGAYPWQGDNALWKLHEALQALGKLFPVPDQEAWQTTMSLAKIETPNIVFNKVPDTCSAYLDFRFIPEEKDTLLKKIKQAVSEEIDIEIAYSGSPQYISPENQFVQTLQQAVTNVTKHKAALTSSHATSDIRLYNAVGCDGVEFGPRGDGDHADNEWVDIKSLEEYYYILEKFLISIGKSSLASE